MKYQNKVEPEKCAGLDDIRREIDAMDQEVIAILGKRFQYVKAASAYKTSESSVRAPERQKAMLAQRRSWAASEGINPDVVEKMYRDLVAYFIAEEMSQWQTDSAGALNRC